MVAILRYKIRYTQNYTLKGEEAKNYISTIHCCWVMYRIVHIYCYIIIVVYTTPTVKMLIATTTRRRRPSSCTTFINIPAPDVEFE